VKLYGVRLTDGRLVWLEADGAEAQSGERVHCLVDGQEEEGLITVTPELLLRGPEESRGKLLAVIPEGLEDDGVEIPLAWLPPLGCRVRSSEATGQVVGLDPVGGQATVLTDGGERVVCDAAVLKEMGWEP
jgi:hypothetical protein